MKQPHPDRSAREAKLRALFAQRILLFDGAMGTMIQRHKLDEDAYRGTRFADHAHPLKGNNDLLTLTQPDIIREIHQAFVDAGSDIIETNTFNATSISQADYHLEPLVAELNEASARLAREVADATEAKTGRPVFVAGAIGPTNRTASLSPDVNRPGYRAVTFNQLKDAYYEQAAALVLGGADTLLIETIFDTLNAKAAIFACLDLFDELGFTVPIQLSVTITDASGRTLSGQTTEAFWNSVSHARPLSVGLNCALGAADMRQYLQELSRVADCYVTCYPNAGLPNAFGEYDDTPEAMAAVLGEFADEGWLNAVGGCCGSTPDHIAAIAARVQPVSTRPIPTLSPALRLSGLEPVEAA